MYFVQPSYLIKQLYPGAIWRMDKEENKIYLTFDDGPVPGVTDWILDLLKESNIKATFFCVGVNVEKNPELFQRIIDEKHSIGNHTYDHLNGWKSDKDEYLKNVDLCEKTFKKHSINNSRLFRPPYGKLKQSHISYLKSHYSIIMWDVLSGDYDAKTSPEKCLENLTVHVRNGSIIVFHDSYKAEAKLKYALPLFIKYAVEKGYSFEML